MAAALGAAVSAAVVVTVYEGKVVVASPSGSAQVQAGEQVTLAPGQPPSPTPAGARPAIAAMELPPAPPTRPARNCWIATRC